VPPGDPVAAREAQVILHSHAGSVRFTVLTEELLRMEYRPPSSRYASQTKQ
jgi:hypothetical protein